MISVDRVYKTLLFFANSDIRGNVTPSELRLALNDTVNEIYEEYIFEVNRAVNRENRGLINGGLENISDRIREKIQYYLQDATLTFLTTTFQLPSDLRYFDSMFYNDITEIEMCKNAKEFKLLENTSDALPTIDYPVYLRQGEIVRVLPSTIQSDVTLFYLRKPLLANWTYTIVSGAETFNPSAVGFQDIDMHPSEENNIVLRTLNRFGINLKEQDLQATTTQKESSDFNQENAS
jgi:hypothetical protein